MFVASAFSLDAGAKSPTSPKSRERRENKGEGRDKDESSLRVVPAFRAFKAAGLMVPEGSIPW
jgi:hypothetical protein